jgi:uncharacterized protein (TIGR01777 family)
VKKIVIAGGTGFIGKYLADRFRDADYEVHIISRKPDCIQWNDEKGIVAALENAEMLINLAGRSVDCRYNEKNKKEILDSRIETTRILGEAVLKCVHPPKLWINSGTATIYRHAEDRPMTESTGETGSGFSVDVAKKWEKTFLDFSLPHTRQIVIRTAIVLGREGGAMLPLKNLVKLGLGGKQGSGKQMFSWIHIEDLYRIILFFQTHSELKGVYNCSSPQPVDNATFMKTLRKSMNVSFGLPSPEWLLKVGAVLIRTEPELVLKSRWVLPERLMEAGFVFKYPELKQALDDILEK